MKKFLIILTFITSYSYCQINKQVSDIVIRDIQNREIGIIPVLTKSKKAIKEEIVSINKNHKIVFREFVVAKRSSPISAKEYFKYSQDCKCLIINKEKEKNAFSFNLAFWGLKPKNNITSYFYSPVNPTNNYTISEVFKQIISTSPNYLYDTSYKKPEIHLLILSLLPKDSYAFVYLNKQLNSINSDYLFILWNKSSEPELPEFIKNNLYSDILIPVSKQTTVYSDKSIKVNFDEVETPIRYKIITSKDTVTAILEENSINYKPNDKKSYVGMVIEKPYRYNIVPQNASDSLRWMANAIKLNNKSKYPINYKLKKIPVYKFYYIDNNEISNTRSLLNIIYNKLDVDSRNPFMLYVSNGSNPYTAGESDEWQAVIKKIGDLNIEPPIIGKDINQIKDIVDLNLIAKRTAVEFNVFMSRNSYKFSINSLLDLFKANSGDDRVINLYLDYDEENVINGCNYFNINKIK